MWHNAIIFAAGIVVGITIEIVSRAIRDWCRWPNRKPPDKYDSDDQERLIRGHGDEVDEE